MTDETIFAAALEKADPAERAAFLDAACGGDAGRRQRLDGLLAALEKAGGFLERPAVAAPDAPGATRAFAPTPNPDAEATRTDDGTRVSGEDDLGFLAPPLRPDSLGRIGHYEVLEVLGRGGFGIVFRAFDEALHRVVAVKVLAPQMAATSPARKRFLREARSSAQVRHEHVVQVHAVEEHPLPYLVMEFIPGETLQQRLDRTGPLDAPEILRIGRQLAEGLAAAHATGLIHRDIKPANVLIEGGSGQRVKLTDFGLARAADDASISQSGVVAGTPMYMAPEQARGEALDHRADLFSLGSVLYALATGRPPFRASGTLAVLKRVCEEDPRPIREVIPEVPEWLCRVVEKLHAKNPADRFQTAREVADVLADCEQQVKAHGVLKDFARIPGGKPTRRRRFRRTAGWAAAALLVVVGVSLAWGKGWAGRLFAPGHGAADAGRGTGPESPPSDGPALAAWGTPVNPAGDCTFDATADGLTVTVPGGRHNLNPTPKFDDVRAPRVLRSVEGDFRIEVRIGHFPPPEAGPAAAPDSYVGAGLVLWQDARNFVRFTRSTNGATGQVFVHFEFFRDGQSVVGNSVNFPANLANRPTALRAARTGDQLRFFYSRDGGNWSEYPPGSPVTLANKLEVGVCAINTTPAAFTAKFDRFQFRPGPESPADDGFVPLFNGRDLTGWKTHPNAPGDWRVEGGAIVGRGATSFLFSEREYADFHLRVVAKVNATGDAGVWCRAPFDVRIAPKTQEPILAGYLAQQTTRPNWSAHTGSLLIRWPQYAQAPQGLHRPDEWFTLEVIAEGNRLRTLVNGKPAAEYRDEQRRFTRGHLALQVWGNNITHVQFRKIEVKELPPGTGDVPPAAAIDLIPLARPDPMFGDWRREGDTLVGLGAPVKGKTKFLAALPIPTPLPREFMLEAVVERLEGEDGIGFTIPAFGKQVIVSFDAFPGNGWRSGLSYIGGKHLLDNGTGVPGRRLVNGRKHLLRITIRAAGVAAELDGKPLFDYRGGYEKIDTPRREYGGVPFIIDIVDSPYRIHSLRLTPLGDPPPAVAPFDAAKAKEHQEAWAKYLGVPVETTNTLGMKLRLVPPGEFTMGNADENPFAHPEDKPQHRVRLTKPFLLGTHEVTVGQFRQFAEDTKVKTHAETDPRGAQRADETGYHAVPGTTWRTPGFPQAADHPVTCVTWAEANAFCEWLSKKEGVAYRLPTDAEWEYACRAGTTTAYHYGPKADPKMAAMQRWGKESGTAPGGSFPANPFGLRDMLGNVYEWCHDGRRTYTPDPATDPLGPTGPGDARVRRGGAWSSAIDQKSGALSGGRTADPPGTEAAHTIGFRVACEAVRPKAAAPDPPGAKDLRDLCAAKELALKTAEARAAAGVLNPIDLLGARVELADARARLAETVGDTAGRIASLEEVVKLRQEERRLVAEGTAAADRLAQADGRVAEAKARLAKVKPAEPVPIAPAPRPKG